jgi:threonine/homoserine/homoserine lactone efflux protein
LAAAALAIPWLRVLLLWGSAGYLLYLALRIALAGATVAFIRPERPPGIGAGIALQIINPKAYAVNTALFSGFAFLPGALLAETLLKFAILNAIWVPIHLAWLAAGVGLRRLDLAPAVQRGINFAMAGAMLAVVALAVRAQL